MSKPSRAVIICLFALYMAGCSAPSRVNPPHEANHACILIPAPEVSVDTIKVSISGSGPRAEIARNEERFLARQVYQTLVTADCTGRVSPGLAADWEPSGASGRLFELGGTAGFYRGGRLTARDVVESLRAGIADSPDVDSARIVSDDRVSIFFRKEAYDIPRQLSASIFSISFSGVESSRPIGTGRYAIAPDSHASTITLHSTSGAPVVVLAAGRHGDIRDLIGGSTDLVVTDDPAAIAYAEETSGIMIEPLPWENVYVLVLSDNQGVGTLHPSFTDRLATDAVRADARGHSGSAWWNAADCDVSRADPGLRPSVALSPNEPPPRIAFRQDDSVGREIAERLVALAASDTSSSPDAAALARAVPALFAATAYPTAIELAEGQFESSLRTRAEYVHILSLPLRAPAPCRDMRELVRRIPWLPEDSAILGRYIIPLVETRPYLIANTRRAGVAVDWWGNLIITNSLKTGS